MTERPDDLTPAMRDRFTAAAAKLELPLPPSVAEIQRLGLKRRRRRLGMSAAVTSAAAAVVAIALVTSDFGTSASQVRPATSPTPIVTRGAVTPTPAPSDAVPSAVGSPSPSAALTTASASSPAATATAADSRTFVTPGPIWRTGIAADGATLYSSTTGQLVKTLAIGQENLLIEPVRHAQVGPWVYFVQTSAPFPQLKRVGPRDLMRVPVGGGTPELLASLTDTQCSAGGCYALTNDATRIAYVTADSDGPGRTIHVRSLANKASTAASIALARLEQPIGWLPDDHTLVLESNTTVDEINVDEPGAKPVTVFQFTAASATCAASSSARLPAATFDDGTIVVLGCADGTPRQQLVNRITPDHAVHPISLREYATWDVTSLHAVNGPAPTIILESIAPGAPCGGYPSLLQVRDDQPRIIASPPTPTAC